MAKKYPSELMFTEYPDLLTTSMVCEILGVSRSIFKAYLAVVTES